MELIVGFFDAERRSPDRWSSIEFNEQAKTFVSGSRYSGTIEVPVLHDDDIARVRTVRDELLRRWSSLAPGEAMEWQFERHPR